MGIESKDKPFSSIINESKSNLKEQTITKIKEFEEYMTLRRRLLNRLSRRLNRVARCADGELTLNLTNPNKTYNILPPPIPKYGDLRHTFEKEDLPNYATKRKEHEEIKNKIKEAAELGMEDEVKRYKQLLIEYEVVIPPKELQA